MNLGLKIVLVGMCWGVAMWPFIIAGRVGLGWMVAGSAMVVLATGVLLAYKMKLSPFTEKRNHW